MLQWLARLWLCSLRLHTVGAWPPGSGVIVLWHEHLPICMRAFRRSRAAVLISHSADGQLAADLCGRWGYELFRGSTSRGGAVGMRSLIRHLKRQNRNSTRGMLAGMALDGPRGPRRSVQPGALWLARHLELPLLPVAVRAERAFRLGTWDQSLIPLPFSRVHVWIGEPLPAGYPEQLAAAMNQAAADLERWARDAVVAQPQPI